MYKPWVYIKINDINRKTHNVNMDNIIRVTTSVYDNGKVSLWFVAAVGHTDPMFKIEVTQATANNFQNWFDMMSSQNHFGFDDDEVGTE